MSKKTKVLCVEHLDNSRKVVNFINDHCIQKEDILMLEHAKDFYALFYFKEEEE